MRIVLDSNVLVRAVISPTGPAAAVHALIQPPDHLLVTSAELLRDVSDALRYANVRALHQLNDREIDEAVLDFQRRSLNVVLPPLQAIAVVSGDRDDDLVIATAVEGQAEALCTRDKHLRAPSAIQYCRQRGIEVLHDVDLLVRLRQ